MAKSEPVREAVSEAAELAELRARVAELEAMQRVLRHYLVKTAYCVGQPTSDPLTEPHVVEEVGEGVLRALDARAEPGTPVFGTSPIDPSHLEKWAGLADVCMFAGCDATETDQRGPVWLRGRGMAKACPEHWEAIMRIIGKQDADR